MNRSSTYGSGSGALTRRQLLKAGMATGGAVAVAMSGLVPIEALAAPLAAGSWRRLAPTASPSARAFAAMAFDGARRNVVLFAGLDAAADTWTYDGVTWHLHAVQGPGARCGSAIAFDQTTDRVVLFGGLGRGEVLSDTWAWDGQSWTELSPQRRPSARVGSALALDPVSGQLVMFGGFSGTGVLNDTWLWSGRSWSEVTSGVRPPPTSGASFGVDPDTRTLMMTAGVHGPMGVPLDRQTWQWMGSSWRVWNAGAPASQLAFAAAAGTPDAFAMFGGLMDGSVTNDGTIHSRGSVMKLGSTRPSARAYASMAYEPSAQGLILFGGQSDRGFLNDSWLWTR